MGDMERSLSEVECSGSSDCPSRGNSDVDLGPDRQEKGFVTDGMDVRPDPADLYQHTDRLASRRRHTSPGDPPAPRGHTLRTTRIPGVDDCCIGDEVEVLSTI